MNRSWDHAIVIGGSLAGLLAARVLARRFRRVTVLERDRLPSRPEARQCAPAARHLQLLLKRGTDALESLFPGFWAEMISAGSVRIDPGRDAVFFREGAWGARSEQSPLCLYLQSRHLIDWQVRQRLEGFETIRIQDKCRVLGLSWDDQRRVSGVRIRRDKNAELHLPADLVVVAAGRNCQLPQWLVEGGCDRVESQQAAVDVTYSSCEFRPNADFVRDWEAMVVASQPESQHCHGMIVAMEGGRWMATVAEYFGGHARDHASFLEKARALPTPDFYQALQAAKPITPVWKHRFASNLWRHYDRMTQFPDRLLALGDCVCSLNPVYAQGMTNATLGVLELADTLKHWEGRSLHGLGAVFQSRLASHLQKAWNWAHALDLRIPQVEGNRSLRWKLQMWYQRRLADLATHDRDVQQRRLSVWMTHTNAADLIRPSIVLKALRPKNHREGDHSRPSRPAKSALSVAQP